MYLAKKSKLQQNLLNSDLNDVSNNKQNKQIEIAKDIFLHWDKDGEGTLDSQELISAFVRNGLSTDHHFAKTIMYAIKPNVTLKKDQEWNMDLKEFIAIFKNDEISENVIKILNDEVNIYRKEKMN